DWAVAKFHAADGTRLWLRRGGPSTGPTDDFIEAVTVDANNDVAAAGFPGTPSTGFQFFVLKVHGADGSAHWLPEQGPAAPNQFNQAFSVVTDAQNDVIAGGYFTVPGVGQLFTVAKFDRTSGIRRWIDQLGDVGGGRAVTVLIDRQGHPVAVGSTRSAAG